MSLEVLRTRTLATLGRFSWVGPLAVRLSLGAVFLGTGWGKLHNLGQVTSFFTELGIPFPAANAAMVSGIELVGGTLILLGLFTRFAALPLMGTMVVAILTAKRPEIEGIRSLLAFDESLYLASFLWLFVAGAGKVSLDALIFGRRSALPGPLLRPDPVATEQR
ncbi:MAG TPA: DoxX family protein [Myxococcaceae bacterium]|nr:DoxX family protein [Myxococcaceae bacterium]